MPGVGVLAPAKLNLFLHVGEKREDGYHGLESLVVFAEAADRLSFRLAETFSLEVAGPFAAQCPSGGDNLVLKAARALANRSGIKTGAVIALEKTLPVASGIGGGSADAAAALRGLNVLWGLDLPQAALMDLAAGLGSDIPACVLSRPCWMAGRGERITPTAAMPRLALVLVNPGVAAPTPAVFAALNARTGLGALEPPQEGIATVWDLVSYLKDSANDLEAPASRLHPVIESVLDALDREPGCVTAQMSGSGATCFGLFDGFELARSAADRMRIERPRWWVCPTRIAGPEIGAPEWLA
jgi:4-diphosphocytidyl-2-C-methyl-D-erythritol kinase